MLTHSQQLSNAFAHQRLSVKTALTRDDQIRSPNTCRQPGFALKHRESIQRSGIQK